MSRFKGIIALTKAQYDALATKDPDTLYLTTDKNIPIPTVSDEGKGILVNSSGEYALGTVGGAAVWGGITGTLANQTDLNTVLTGKQDTSNLVTSLSAESTDSQYPSAKCVYDICGNVVAAINTIRGV